jgi:autotransporter-associated beta strand protein
LNQGTLAIGNNSALGPYQFILGDSTGANVVTFKSASTSPYVISNYVIVYANNFILDTGGNLTFGGPINLGTGARTATVNNSSIFTGAVTNTASLTKAGTGTLTFSGSTINTYGATMVSAGKLVLSKANVNSAIPVAGLTINSGATLQSGAANQINDSAPMTLAGGTWLTQGYGEQLGTLKLTGSSTINLGSSGTVKFAASSGMAWTASAVLSIAAWNGWANGGGPSQLFAGTASTGLTAAQLSQIQFINPMGLSGNFAAKMLASGEIVPAFSPPTFSSQPQPQVAVAGANVTFTVTAGGTSPLSYQWKSGTNLVSGGTNSSLTLTNVAVTQSGPYSVVAANVAGTNTSNPAQLSVYATAAATLGLATRTGNGQFSFGISGVPGWRYVIQSSTNLPNWVPVQTNIAPFTFTDTNAGNPLEFYRALCSQ